MQANINKTRFHILLIADDPDHIESLEGYFDEVEELETTVYKVGETTRELADLSSADFDLVMLDSKLASDKEGGVLNLLQVEFSDLPWVVFGDCEEGTLAALAVQAGAQDYLQLMETSAELLYQTIEHSLLIYRQRVEQAQLSPPGVGFKAAEKLPGEQRVGKIQQELQEWKRIQGTLQRKDTILEAVGLAAERFLRTPSWEENVPSVLSRLGEATGVSRVYIFENRRDENGTRMVSQRYEWTAPGIEPQFDKSEPQESPFWAGEFGRWEQVLSQGKVIAGQMETFPEKERALLASKNIQSLVLVPIFSGDTWWGFIRLDDCEHKRVWLQAEIEALKAAAGTIGSAIQGKRAEQALKESEERYRKLFDNASVGIGFATLEGTLLAFNDAVLAYSGFSREEIEQIGNVRELYCDPEERDETLKIAGKQGYLLQREVRFKRKGGGCFDALLSLSPITLNGQRGWQAVIEDITEKKQAEKTLEIQARQQAAVAQLGQRALEALEIDGLFKEAATLVVETLEVEYCKVLELLPGQDKLVMRAGVGWKPGTVGKAIVEASPNTQAGYTLKSEGPVVVEDREKETRFQLPTLLLDHSVVSGLSTIIYDGERPFGVLGAHTSRQRAFSDDDAHFLQAVANVLASAIRRIKTEGLLRRRLGELTILNTIATAGAEATSEDVLIERAVEILAETIYPEHFGLLLVEEDKNALRPHPSYRGIKDASKTILVPLGVGVSGKVAQSGKARRVPDVSKEPDFIQADGPEIQSELCVPLKVGKRVLGVINAESSQLDAFTEEDERLLFTLAGQLATAIEKVRLLETETRRRQEAEILQEASTALTTSLEIEQVLDRILTQLAHVVPYDSASVMLLEEQELQLVAGRGFPKTQEIIGMKLPASDPFFLKIRTTRKPVRVENMREDPSFSALGGVDYVRGWLGVPLVARGEVIGCLTLDSRREDAYDTHDEALAQALANQATAVLENARLFAETTRSLERLQALRNIDAAITSSVDLRVTLNVILDQVIGQLKVDAVAILLHNTSLKTLEYKAGRGFYTTALQHTRLRLGQGNAGRAALQRRIVHIPDLNEEKTSFDQSPYLANEGFVSYYGVPLSAKGQIKGVLEVFHRTKLHAGEDWLNFLEALATQAAIAIDNAELFDSLQRSNLELSLAYDTTLEGWSRALELRDLETEGHSQRVTEMTEALARKMGINEGEMVHLRRGALLHDIGKMGIPDGILLQPGPLTEEDWEIMRQHPIYAYELLNRIPFLRPALDIPYCHHEKWDGSGYPQGLKGEQIPLAARIFTTVDVWDALTSDRPYRRAWEKDKARAYIQGQKGKHFDPEVVEAFMEILEAR